MKQLNLTWDNLFEKDHLPVEVLRRSPQPAYPLHTHDFSELVIVLNGSGVHFTDEDEFLVSKGDSFVIQGRQAHGYKRPDNLELVNIAYDPSILTVPGYDLFDIPGYHSFFTLEPQFRKHHRFKSRLHLSSTQLEFASGCIGAMEREINGGMPGKIFCTTALFMQLVVYISRCYQEPLDGRLPVESRKLLKFGEVLAYLRKNYSDPIRIETLTDISGMSESSLLRAFNRIAGCSPSEYLIRLRLNQACGLLKQTSKPITEISFDIGFNDSNYFSRQFKKVIGQSPRSYRSGGRSV
jgi:AraC-like DNA-binding protein